MELHSTTSGPLRRLAVKPLQVGGKVALRFTAFDYLKGFFKDSEGKVTAIGNLCAGTMAGAIEAVVWTCPTERVKVLNDFEAAAWSLASVGEGDVTVLQGQAVFHVAGFSVFWVRKISSHPFFTSNPAAIASSRNVQARL